MDSESVTEQDGPLLDLSDLGLDSEPEAEPGAPSDSDPSVPDFDLVDTDDKVASNDEWAYQQADRMTASLPQREGVNRRTEGEVFDHQTLMTLHKLLSHGTLRSLDFPISTGKEANVFRGTTPTGGHVAVKIYRINTATFKHVLKYIQGDERFEGVTGDKKALVFAWAQKEFRNLHRLRDAGIRVPEPIKVLNNVLVTEFLGADGKAWPKLKDLGRIERAQATKFWESIRDDYVNAYNKAKLVHADLSEYNILVENFEDPKKARLRIIDVGQAVLKNHPMAWEFLARDAKNLTSFFKRHRVRCTPEDLTNLLEHPA